MLTVYDYFDYRQLLRDLYADRKRANPIFSYRYIGQKAGFKSSGYFTNVLKGKCNISLNVAYKLAGAFKLKKQEAEYFALLVLFNLAKTQTEKKQHFDKLMAMRKSKSKTLNESQFMLFDQWYYLAIREILTFHRFKDDYKELAGLVVPEITPAEAKKAIEVLSSLEMIRKNPSGYYEQVDSVLTTADSWTSAAIANFQLTTLELARKSLESCDRKLRDISTLTVSINADDFKLIRERLVNVQDEILSIASSGSPKDRVYQINLQVFPLSKIKGAG